MRTRSCLFLLLFPSLVCVCVVCVIVQFGGDPIYITTMSGKTVGGKSNNWDVTVSLFVCVCLRVCVYVCACVCKKRSNDTPNAIGCTYAFASIEALPLPTSAYICLCLSACLPLPLSIYFYLHVRLYRGPNPAYLCLCLVVRYIDARTYVRVFVCVCLYVKTGHGIFLPQYWTFEKMVPRLAWWRAPGL